MPRILLGTVILKQLEYIFTFYKGHYYELKLKAEYKFFQTGDWIIKGNPICIWICWVKQGFRSSLFLPSLKQGV
jgi:hypothetical protein